MKGNFKMKKQNVIITTLAMALGLAIALPGYSVSEPNEPMVMEAESEPSPPMFYSEPFSPIDMIGGKEVENWLNERYASVGLTGEKVDKTFRTDTLDEIDFVLAGLDWLIGEVNMELFNEKLTPEQKKNFHQLRTFINSRRVEVLKKKVEILL